MSKQPKVDIPDLKVKIFTPFKIYYEGPAISLTATNKTGVFDVLPGHANFFSVLDACEVVINTGTEAVKVPIDEGVIKVSANTITLFANV